MHTQIQAWVFDTQRRHLIEASKNGKTDQVKTLRSRITQWRGVLESLIKQGYEVATISRLPKNISLFCKEPYQRDYILQTRPIFLRSLLIIATQYLSRLVVSVLNG